VPFSHVVYPHAVGQVRLSHYIYLRLGPTSLTDLDTTYSMPILPTSVLAFQRSWLITCGDIFDLNASPYSYRYRSARVQGRS